MKKSNRLEQKKLNDLVFIKYNKQLYERYDRRDAIDPISLKDIDDSNEWLVGRLGNEFGIVEDANDDELVFDDDDELTWGLVSRYSGVEEPERILRSTSTSTPSSSKKKAVASSSKQKRTLEVVDEEDEEDVEFDSEEGLEDCGYESNNEEEDINDDDEDEAFDEDDDY